MSYALDIASVTLEHDGEQTLNNISLQLQQGDIACLLGPSGCGKTSLLRCICGFTQITQGAILIDNFAVSTPSIHLPPEQRSIGMVFQDLALFPHLNVRENISFGIQHLPAVKRHKRLNDMLELTSLGNYCNRYPHELSGGQQQRVALARSLAPKPKLLLLDEPFSSLDHSLRLKLAHNVRQLIKEQNTTTLMVTHDQTEALAIADMLGVLNEGQLLQWNTPYNVYHEPASYEVANFIGMSTTLSGCILDGNRIRTALGVTAIKNGLDSLKPGDSVSLLIRPDDIIHNDDSKLHAVILEKQFRGAEFLYQLQLDNGEMVFCFAPSHHDHSIGESIGIVADIEHSVIFSQAR